MGKVKVRVVGDETLEQEQKEEQKKKREAKKAQVKGLGLGGGQRINTVGISEEEIAKDLDTKPTEETGKPQASEEPAKKERKARKIEVRERSKRHNENTKAVAKNTKYSLKNSLELLRKFKKSNFDETVELHINTKEKGVSGQVTLPHGTGKKLRIAIADDALITEIEKGKINFDILVAEPEMMPKLARVARVLGPRGLMPNPKSGTISDKPQALVEKLSAGQISFKTEPQAPIIHMSVGKLSFDDSMLSENVKAALSAVGGNKIMSVTLKSTMSPGIKLSIS